jgi:anti-sigma regulatory factor (Ser/Thr protein kinase)/5-hydroxyisourate hydrolase-like protein (transthyretin family)
MSKLQQKTKEIRQFILENVEEHPSDITTVVSMEFSISRQASHRHIQKLVSEGLMTASGNTRNRTYKVKPLVNFSVEVPLAGLEEDKAWRVHIRPLMNGLPTNVLSICQYGFTEIVNNAIDHSEGTILIIGLVRTYKNITLRIIDNGVGIFNKIQKELNLDDPLHAVLELSKGKLTTDPARHTGEGIFFTSRMFDKFTITSGNLFFSYEGEVDWQLEDRQEFFTGTDVQLEISPLSERTTQQVFDRFTVADDYGFSKTHVPVLLATYGDENLVSRSQARRLLTRFERFKEIMLDFTDVSTIGQAFADEIFRVFQTQNPSIHLVPINMSEQVRKMISRVTSQK